jgi:hypothetical protein
MLRLIQTAQTPMIWAATVKKGLDQADDDPNKCERMNAGRRCSFS